MTSQRLRRRLGLALLGYLLTIVLLLTLLPFRFVLPAEVRLAGYRGASDLVANVVLFLPLGFFLEFAFPARPVWGFLRAFLAGGAVSMLIELVQLLEPSRVPSLIDVAANAAGAGAGAWVYVRTAAALARAGAGGGVFALDLPLVGLLYLAVPLVWLGGLHARFEPERTAPTLLLGLLGVVVFAALDRHHVRPRGGGCEWVVPLAAAGWVLLGMLPGWYQRPAVLLGGSLGAGLAVAALSSLIGWVEPMGRRYETTTLQRVLPLLVIYLLLAGLWPLTGWTPGWSVTVGVNRWARELDQSGLVRLVEWIAGFTVLGYALAEGRGRRVESRLRGFANVLGAALALAALLAATRGFHPRYQASVVDVLLAAGGVAFGGTLYWLQRAYVQAFLREPSGTGAPAASHFLIPAAGAVGTAPRSGDRGANPAGPPTG